jgi:hypothetical protein
MAQSHQNRFYLSISSKNMTNLLLLGGFVGLEELGGRINLEEFNRLEYGSNSSEQILPLYLFKNMRNLLLLGGFVGLGELDGRFSHEELDMVEYGSNSSEQILPLYLFQKYEKPPVTGRFCWFRGTRW